MKKVFCCLGVFLIVILAVWMGIHAYANASKEKIFTGIDGKEIIVHSDNFFILDMTGNNTKQENVKVGDIIGSGTEQEIVIGVSTDGQFITMPLSDYEIKQD